jgi:hypothetical protein
MDTAEIYDELRRRKAAGEVFDWSTITRERLRQLYLDYDLLPDQIADLYDVTKAQVNAKRRALEIYLSDKPLDAETRGTLDAVVAEYRAKVVAAALATSEPYDSRYQAPSGRHWRLTLNDSRLRITRTVEGSPDREWTCDSRDEALALIQQVSNGPLPEAAAAAGNDTIISPPLDKRESAWLEGSLRTALRLWA